MSVIAIPTTSLGAWTLARVFLRSLFIQAAWNRKGMQNIGFAYALGPALARLFPDHAARTRAVERHLAFFNTHPYMAAAILGGVVRIEERVARGQAPETAPAAFKNALLGPFAAIGDGFFWTGLRPLAGMVAVLAAAFHTGWALVGFVVTYNVTHLVLRTTLFVWGYRRGEEVIDAVGALRLPAAGATLRLTAAALVGLALEAHRVHAAVTSGHIAAAALLGTAVAGYLALRLGARLYAVLYGSMALVAVCGALWG